jgi:2-keto-4-pentenoate hydratase/2-oxohepta-3-ene-1,7-dioic acid hydratase in catechol pathway
MNSSRRVFLSGVSGLAATGLAAQPQTSGVVVKYVRYEQRGKISYGILEGETIKPLRGDLFGNRAETGTKVKLREVKLLWPCEPSKVLAVGLNYKSHLGNRPAPDKPELFFKPLTSLVEPNGEIVIPPGARNVHYEGKLAIVIGKQIRRVMAQEATGYVFGLTCGNDVSERDWQRGDLQWGAPKGPTRLGRSARSSSLGWITKSPACKRVLMAR